MAKQLRQSSASSSLEIGRRENQKPQGLCSYVQAVPLRSSRCRPGAGGNPVFPTNFSLISRNLLPERAFWFEYVTSFRTINLISCISTAVGSNPAIILFKALARGLLLSAISFFCFICFFIAHCRCLLEVFATQFLFL